MSVYGRFKRSLDGFRQLVELLESTPAAKRAKMVEVGMKEDPEYTQKALAFVLTFEDVLKLPDLELAEVLAGVPARLAAYAIHGCSPEVKARFVSMAQPQEAAEMKETLETEVTKSQMGGGQFKLIEATRKLEKKGMISTKRITQ